MIGIYKITSPTGKVYIGQSVNIDDRRRKYSQENCKNQIRLHRSILKHGWDNHIFEVIEECAFNDLNKRERHWQEFYNCMDKNIGLNCNLTGTDELKKVHSEETKRRIGDANKGRKYSEEYKLKMSERMKGRFAGEKHPLFGKKMLPESVRKMGLHKIGNKNMLGKKHSEETKKKLSEANLGRKHSLAAKEKISNASKGRLCSVETRMLLSQPRSDEVKRKISEANKGRIPTLEQRAKMSQSHMGHKRSKESLEKQSKSTKGEKNCKAKLIVNLETGIYYGCIEDAAKAHNMFRSTLNGYLVGFRKNKTSLRYA